MISYKGGNGTIKQEAIIILRAENEMEGADAEYDYLNSKYGEYELLDQTFVGEDQKQFDILNIQLSDGTSVECWFDISDFYGK